MIVRPVGDNAELVMQVDHALLSGDLADAWGSEAVPALDPPAEVRLAARLHDCGWRSWEDAPVLDPETGRPENFLDVEVPRHLVFYQAAVDEVAGRDRYAGMLVSKHAAGIYTGRYGTQPGMLITRAPEVQSAVDAFVARQEAWHEGLRAELGVSEDELWRNYMLLQVFDRLSLWLCKGDPAGTGRMEIPLPGREEPLVIEPTDDGARLDPYPFIEEGLIVHVPVRTVPLTGYADDADLQARIRAAPVERRAARLVSA
jgi:hypothetical protein